MINVISNKLLALCAALLLSVSVQATTVQFQTSFGDFTVNLYDESTPATVENFLAYVNSGAYTDVAIQRSVPNFVIQAGAYTVENDLPVPITSLGNVVNEPVFSNVAGTIAMARQAGQIDSASNQWFFNLSDNNNNLDYTDEGFTAFGEITESGLEVLEVIAALPRFNIDNGNFATTPLQNITGAEFLAGTPVTADNYVFVSVVVLDAAIDTAAGLSPALSVDAPVVDTPPPATGGSGGGGGSFGALLLLVLIQLKRRISQK